MGSIFVKKDETVTIAVWVGEDKNKKTRYWSREEDKPDNVESSTRYEIEFRKPNFRDSTVLMDLGVRMNAAGGMELAFNEIRYRRLEILLKKWNLKDGDGKSVPANAESLANLHPTFAMVLASALERELGLEDAAQDDLDSEQIETGSESEQISPNSAQETTKSSIDPDTIRA